MDHHLGGFQIPAMVQPTLMNQPPQIFGTHAYDGMRMQNLSPELTAQMFGDSTMLLDDSNEAKRRRIARVSPVGSACVLGVFPPASNHTTTHHTTRHGTRTTPCHSTASRYMVSGARLTPRRPQACDMCRKKKIKCDGKLPACTHCINYKTECVFTQVEKKRNPPKG